MEEIDTQVRVIALDRLRDVLDGRNVEWDRDAEHWHNNSFVFLVCELNITLYLKKKFTTEKNQSNHSKNILTNKELQFLDFRLTWHLIDALVRNRILAHFLSLFDAILLFQSLACLLVQLLRQFLLM